MKLINVEYIEESSSAIFFNVEFAVYSFWRENIKIKRAFLKKCTDYKGGWYYDHYFMWADNTETFNFDKAVIQEMILKYEQKTK